jgi:hypothetical protein
MMSLTPGDTESHKEQKKCRNSSWRGDKPLSCRDIRARSNGEATANSHLVDDDHDDDEDDALAEILRHGLMAKNFSFLFFFRFRFL